MMSGASAASINRRNARYRLILRLTMIRRFIPPHDEIFLHRFQFRMLQRSPADARQRVHGGRIAVFLYRRFFPRHIQPLPRPFPLHPRRPRVHHPVFLHVRRFRRLRILRNCRIVNRRILGLFHGFRLVLGGVLFGGF